MITVALHTSRRDPKFSWFMDSLARQKGIHRVTQIIIVDFYAQSSPDWSENEVLNRRAHVKECAGGMKDLVWHVSPKPTIWQGPHRVTKENHWAMSSARNTSFCLCKNDWIVMLDDRAVLQQGYLQAVKRAMSGKFIVFGGYQKRHNLVVEKGVIRGDGDVSGVDNRDQYANGKCIKANGSYAYGCSFAMPLEWALEVNGYPEMADGLSFEDILFGKILENNGYPMRYDPSMRVIQDRTPSELDAPFKRSDKGVSPNDKSHASLTVIGGKKRSEHEWDLRQIRQDVLAGKPFPVPTNPNPLDWYDQQPIREL